jgi:hypothetical protein
MTRKEGHEMSEWFDLQEQQIPWLIHGLITTDDNAAANGKPKSGKSTGIRNLVTAVVMGGKFLGREVCIPPNTGRVYYLHLDRKDKPAQVAAELKRLGITREASLRLRFKTEKDVPKDVDNNARCLWLAEEVAAFKPDLVVIDLFLHFVRTKKGVNDYDTMLDAIAQLQDSLTAVDYRGALLVSLHARKAAGEDVGDSVLGSTGIRGSLSTILHFRHYRRDKVYTVTSDQTHRDESIGEIDESIVNRDSGTGVISLGAAYEDVRKESKRSAWETNRIKILRYITAHAGKASEEIAGGVKMSKPDVLEYLEAMLINKDIYSTGEGKKGDPKRYFGHAVTVAKPPQNVRCPKCNDATDSPYHKEVCSKEQGVA